MSDNDDGDCCYPIRDTNTMTDHAQRAEMLLGNMPAVVYDELDKIPGAVGRMKRIIKTALTQAHAAGRREAFEEAEQAQELWQNNRAEFYRRYRHNSFSDWCRAKATADKE